MTNELSGYDQALSKWIKAVPDFPISGILFRDITPLLSTPSAFARSIDRFAELCEQLKVECIVGAESRGFIFGAPLAQQLNLPFVPVRKPGKLPRATESVSYSLEYGEDTLEIHKDDLSQGQRVVFIDDLLATGGTAAASVSLIEKLGAQVVSCLFLIELVGLGGRARLASYPCTSLIHYQED